MNNLSPDLLRIFTSLGLAASSCEELRQFEMRTAPCLELSMHMCFFLPRHRPGTHTTSPSHKAIGAAPNKGKDASSSAAAKLQPAHQNLRLARAPGEVKRSWLLSEVLHHFLYDKYLLPVTV